MIVTDSTVCMVWGFMSLLREMLEPGVVCSLYKARLSWILSGSLKQIIITTDFTRI